MDATTDIAEAKRALRVDASARRRAAKAADKGDAGERLAAQVIGSVPIPDAAPVSGFWPIGDEIDTMPLLRALAARGHTIALPVVAGRGRPLVFRRWVEGDGMAVGPFGIREPLADAPAVTPCVMLVPLLAFDSSGYRLGYGGGFYDRTIARLRESGTVLAAGVAWAAQEVDAVPRDAHDARLDLVVTEQGVIRIAGAAA